jgi:hypothetical protein
VSEQRADPDTWAFDPYTPAWLDERRLHGKETTLSALRLRGCHCCPWCQGSICATAEQVQHCGGGCEHD